MEKISPLGRLKNSQRTTNGEARSSFCGLAPQQRLCLTIELFKQSLVVTARICPAPHPKEHATWRRRA
jgi:hypothetical protein